MTKGASSIGTFNKPPGSSRKWCTKCGGPKLKFEPGVHVHYQETVLPIKDGKPKFKDMPAEMGGSGETLPE